MANNDVRLGYEDDDFEKTFLHILIDDIDQATEGDDDANNKVEDDLDKIFPNISYWCNLDKDILNYELLYRAIEKYNPSIQRARGPRGSLADRLRRAMFNGMEVPNLYSSILLISAPPSDERSCELTVMDCILRDRNLIRLPQQAFARSVTLNRLRRRPDGFTAIGIEDKVLLWKGFNSKRPFTFLMKPDYNLTWRFSTCNNDFVVARQIVDVEQYNEVTILQKTVVRHRLVVAIGAASIIYPEYIQEYCFDDEITKEFRCWNIQIFHMVLDVKTATWSLLELYPAKWEYANICFGWNRRLYVWNISANLIRYFDFEVGQWVQSGLYIKTLTSAFAQLRQILINYLEETFSGCNFSSDNLLVQFPYKIILVASRSETLFCINIFCKLRSARHNLVYAMSDINSGWRPVDLGSIYDSCPLKTQEQLYYWPALIIEKIYKFPQVWPMGEDSIVLVVFKKSTCSCSWFMIDEKGIQQFNDIQFSNAPPGYDLHKANPVIVESNLGMI